MVYKPLIVNNEQQHQHTSTKQKIPFYSGYNANNPQSPSTRYNKDTSNRQQQSVVQKCKEISRFCKKN